ncbi:MAG: hypothetical protein H6713_22610 [Myxococcales bacterium]|nr:hypothetical protein [Myxococcales bacterium]
MNANAPRIDAKALIDEDLAALQQERRRHFVPALVVALGALLLAAVLSGVRGDMFSQPAWKVALQIAVWVQCLLVLPAIGLGLIFPGRAARVGVVGLAAVTTLLAGVGMPTELPSVTSMVTHAVSDGFGCVAYVFGAGLALLALGYFSGAFVQRRRSQAVLWVTAGIAMATLDAVTWHCPATDPTHTISTHVGAAVVILVITSVLAIVIHARR